MPVSDWSTTASDNATADSASGIVLNEGQAPGSLNDSIRALMAVIKGDFANSLANPGYQRFPNGLIAQWGSVVLATNGDGGGMIGFPMVFPTAALTIVLTNGDHSGAFTPAVIASQFAASQCGVGLLPASTNVRVNYIVIGH